VTDKIDRYVPGPIEVVALERGHGRSGIVAETVSVPEQSGRSVPIALFSGDNPEHRAAHGGNDEHVGLRIDAVGEPARAAGQIEVERFGRRHGGLTVAAVNPVEHGQNR
jgi:hypothetical protein